MKVKTSVSLSRELLDAIDEACGDSPNRSGFLERVAWKALREQRRRERDARDIEIYAKYEAELNADALSDLDLQADVD